MVQKRLVGARSHTGPPQQHIERETHATPLCFVGMIAAPAAPYRARRLAAEMIGDVAWALALAQDIDRWQAAFA
jgi:hypothetical protein